ncbi:hypothetical protein J2Z32_001660 [Paenibacillus turicensis]|uniref:Uncharacterized protein n=2 Tax=Paenibacillus turicensis TaxID=160487 RepID=A0ABS4FR53_9BACL|nr:hypothetical protein [Paenibacillus turicensis]
MFPKTLDYYQIELTRMLETERYSEAMDLLSFLLSCEGQDPKHYEEWQSLLEWLMSAFPQSESNQMQEETEDEELFVRKHIEQKLHEDPNYGEKLLDTVINQPMSERSLLALEQLAFVDLPQIDDALLNWISNEELHPLLQFRVIQILARRGNKESFYVKRGKENVEIQFKDVPLKTNLFPYPIQAVLERVEEQAAIHNPTLFYFAQELWYQFIMSIYGTVNYKTILKEDDTELDIWAGALHAVVSKHLPDGNKQDEEIRVQYGITDHFRLRFEQACRAIEQFVALGISL